MNYNLNAKYAHCKDFLLQIRDYFTQNGKTIHKARNELKIIQCGSFEVVVKSFKVPNFVNQIVYGNIRDSKAKKSYENGLRLDDLGVCTPKPIGYIEFYDGSFFKESFFIAKKYEYDFTIREPLLDKNFENREQVFKEFAQFTLSLHEKGIYHKDYSPGNILIKKHKKRYEFCIVDINRMEFGRLSLKTKLQNFAKLWIDDADLKYVVSEYAKLSNQNEELLVQMALYFSTSYKKSKEFRRNIKRKLFGK